MAAIRPSPPLRGKDLHALAKLRIKASVDWLGPGFSEIDIDALCRFRDGVEIFFIGKLLYDM